MRSPGRPASNAQAARHQAADSRQVDREGAHDGVGRVVVAPVGGEHLPRLVEQLAAKGLGLALRDVPRAEKTLTSALIEDALGKLSASKAKVIELKALLLDAEDEA